MRDVMTREERSAKNIKAIRTGRKMSQEQFADILDVATNTVSRIERGETSVSAEVALKINEKFYVCMDYLFGLSSEEEGEPPCSKTCEELLNAQTLVEVQMKELQELHRKIEAVMAILGEKTREIKLKSGRST